MDGTLHIALARFVAPMKNKMSNTLDTMLVRDTQRYVGNCYHNFLWYIRHATIRHATLR